jgi:RNA polymerase sigma-70 factor (sigma-E family)
MLTEPSPPVPDEFARFYREQYGSALRLAWLLTGSRSVAEDIVHDVMTRMYRTRDRIREPAPYLRRSIVHGVRMWQRDERRRAIRLTRLAGQPSREPPPNDRMLDAVRRLPYRQRVVIVLRYWGDLTEVEIAAALGCRPGTVKSLASRALDRLREEVPQ